MTSVLRGLVLALLLSSGSAAADRQVSAEAVRAFDRLVADYESWRLAENPIEAGRRGDLEALARWPEAGPTAVDRRRARSRQFLARLDAIDPAELPAGDRTSHAVLAYLLGSAVARASFDEERMPFVNDSGFFTMPLYVAASTRPKSRAEAEAWIARLDALPAWLDTHVAWMQRGVAAGFVQPALVVEAVLAQLDTVIATAPEDSPLLAPIEALPPRVAAVHGETLRAETLARIESGVLPAYRRIAAFFRTDYLAEPRRSIGISEVPDGRAYYRALVRHHTTRDTTPQAVHEQGLAEVARIRAEMEAIVAELEFDGSFADFLHFLRTDPRFYAETPDELIMHASWIAKRADDAMPRFFGRLPRLPYGVRPVPDHLAPTYTTGRYWPGDLENGVAGGYMVNTHALNQRPLYALPALTLHEAVPGHHHQGALAQELEDVPDFRRTTYITAFGEGWALYTEHLGIEMGIYRTPYEHFGRLTYEMWRACRLVVDTGIHYFGWSREQAEACLLENSALAPHNVRTEVTRYIAWPGQALAYKTGELLIRQLRADAEARLGDGFDLRAFHDHLLGQGAMPLDALESRMRDWIELQHIAAGP
ncbi:DUF885 domain-containing protein [Wenzhouxiangella sp. XN79A]|uniref:DUF885 domain-containing protein n=1 Tax=Wenzhouxiangella sp. XN79A TaxID=2724193 RepID=UPI00144AF991|nr:DUF885 domain-containing protein [Wenzhouxiangella sp. XN79A]NKI34972.1 DUF885 domain-containing protein [Wenzhouxiangella sp. XN79A]